MRDFFKSKFCGATTYLICLQILVFFILFVYRLIFFIVGYENTIYAENKWSLIFNSFLLSLRFDNIVASHVLIIPLLILPILALLNIFNKKLLVFFNIYYIIIYSIVFLVSCMDIPYFQYFFRHINASIFNWMEYGNETAGMVFTEKSYYLYFLLYIVSISVFIFFTLFISRKILKYFTKRIESKYYILLAVTILFIGYGLCYIGSKGRIRGSGAFDVQHAYFSNNSFINQMSITPVFYLYKSMEYNKPNTERVLMDQSEALDIAGKYLGIDLKNNGYLNKITNNDTIQSNPQNIVIILIESFSNDYLKIMVDDKPLMPYINSMIDNSSYYFDNFYSQGTHTNQGIVSSLFGFPSLFERHMMKSLDIGNFGRIITLEDEFQDKNSYPAPIYNGLPKDLKERGYETMFFTTHIAIYDNAKSALLNNGVNKLFSQEDYPPSSWVNIWGVNDEFLLNYALTQMDTCAIAGKPFFAGLMTISNHPPYSLPSQFSNLPLSDDRKAMAYTDHCIKEFMREASLKEWYNNTTFIFLGDHGKITETSRYNMPLSLNHVPLIIYSPTQTNVPQRISSPAGQIDIYPTVMGLLKYEPSYNSFGIDILNKDRKFVYFTSDEKLGCIGNNLFYVYDLIADQHFLYDLITHKNIKESNDNVVNQMKTYSFSMVESAKYILKNELNKSE